MSNRTHSSLVRKPMANLFHESDFQIREVLQNRNYSPSQRRDRTPSA